MQRDPWKLGLHLVIWIGAFLILSPEPLGLGQIQMGALGPRPLSLSLFFSFLIDVVLVYSFRDYALPKYLSEPKPTTFWLINLAYLLGFSMLKAIFDFGYASFLHANEGDLPSFFGGAQMLLKGEPPATFVEWLTINLITTAIVLFLANAYGFISEWWNGRRIRSQLENEKLRMELYALKHQINPHFLFNILNGLYALALKNDDDPTADGIEKLSRMMRYVLYESNDQFVELSKEIEYIENYISLQRLRVSRNTEIHFTVEGNVSSETIAPMLFIPFIENAFKHGISTVNASYIDIVLRLEESNLWFSVRNPVHNKGDQKPDQFGGIGLENVKKRLALLYPNRYELDLEDKDGEFRIELRIRI